MNPTQLAGLFRDVGKLIAVFVAAKGGLDGSYVELIGGMVSMFLLSAWSYYTNKTTSMISAVAASEKVKEVVTTPEIAKNDPNPKVVS